LEYAPELQQPSARTPEIGHDRLSKQEPDTEAMASPSHHKLDIPPLRPSSVVEPPMSPLTPENTQDKRFVLPELLHRHCRGGKVEGVRSALRGGIDVNIKDSHGNTLLITAISPKRHPLSFVMVNLLIDEGADLEPTDFWGNTALLLACKGVTPCYRSVERLLAKDLHGRCSNYHAKNAKGLTAFHLLACQRSSTTAPLIAKFLIERGANYDETNNERERNRPIHYACMSGTPEFVKLLLDRAVKIEGNSLGFTPLHVAAAAGRKDIIEVLVKDKNVNVNTEVDLKGATALHLAVTCKLSEDPSAVICLLKYGADPNALDRNGETPLFYAIRAGKRAAASKDVQSSKIHEEVSRILLRGGALINKSSARGEKCVYVVNGNGKLQIVKSR
jgi:ankyrin repeat protein